MLPIKSPLNIQWSVIYNTYTHTHSHTRIHKHTPHCAAAAAFNARDLNNMFESPTLRSSWKTGCCGFLTCLARHICEENANSKYICNGKKYRLPNSYTQSPIYFATSLSLSTCFLYIRLLHIKIRHTHTHSHTFISLTIKRI